MKYRIKSLSLLAVLLFFSVSTTYARLARDWQNTYTPADEWQTVCAYEGKSPCPAGNTYYYIDSKLIVLLSSSGRPRGYHHLYIASYNGECASGSFSIDGEKAFDLEKYRDFCRIRNDLKFADEGRLKTGLTIPVSMLEEASQITITLVTVDGENHEVNIPMTGFNLAFEGAKKLMGGR